ncbi:leucine--tRNA ligase [Corynebacterium kroppenstedtii]|uniref:leucine--tRNA ligase n=1 Tax=Corynebacterium sp. PCR 32 TaxID=3351342 RepID=UPI00309C98E9
MTNPNEKSPRGGQPATSASASPSTSSGSLSSQSPASPPGHDEPRFRYTAGLAADIEKAWHQRWSRDKTFHAPNPAGDLAPRDGDIDVPDNRIFIQDMFPYPSGVGLHVGHPLGYIATDVYARFHRMLGKNVLHTLGYDAYGLPAEQYAVQTGTHPRVTTEANIENMKRQLERLGLGHDPRRSFATTDQDFYRWTQWIFLQIFQSWFDPEAQAARPVTELRDKLASGDVDISSGPGYESMDPATGAVVADAKEAGTNSADIWATLDDAQREHVIETFRLVYRSRSTVNWAPGLGTVLANEEVTADGRSERGNFPVFRKKLTQWMMRITEYSDRLLDDLDLLDWPDKVKSMQRNWIGRSRGAEVTFTIPTNSAVPGAHTDSDNGAPGVGTAALGGASAECPVFTTRPDTLFGAQYLVLAPEHDLVDTIVAEQWPDLRAEHSLTDDAIYRWTSGAASPAEAVTAYRASIAAKSDLERQENKDKTGVFLGTYATNPVDGRRIPVFIADYVLAGYGTGAIMAVPAHDERDYDFARVFELPIKEVISGGDVTVEAFTGTGTVINSANDDGLDINGLSMEDAKVRMIEWLATRGVGTEKIQYKLRDWLFARQRYWGEPFPIVYDENDVAHALPESMLPVVLPEVDDYRPVAFDPDDADSEPHPPLAKATDWVTVELDLGDGPKTYRRDTNVMPQWAGSSWYELRYVDPTNSNTLCDPANEKYWMGPTATKKSGGVDLYVGGVEHAVLHLLYSRFWHKVLYDLGHVSSCEPYHRLFNQGYIQAYAYTDDRGVYIPAAEVIERDGSWWWTPTDGRQMDGVETNEHGEIQVHQEYGKMGKSLKNAVSPDDICDNYGADTLRIYEMAMGPLDTSRPWATKDVVGAQRFLQRLWRLVVDESTGSLVVTDSTPTDDDLRTMHRTIAAVREDYAQLMDNTAVAKLIEYVNYVTKTYPGGAPREIVEPAVLLVAPLAPHIAEELWSRLGHVESLAHGPFPTFDEAWLVDDTIEIPIQVQGRVRSRIHVATDASREDIESAALDDAKVKEHVGDRAIKKVIVVPGRMVNVVI